jgi:hypothetical protein
VLDPSGMMARQQPMQRVRRTALRGTWRLGETWWRFVSLSVLL